MAARAIGDRAFVLTALRATFAQITTRISGVRGVER
jgi:hypothetical protein